MFSSPCSRFFMSFKLTVFQFYLFLFLSSGMWAKISTSYFRGLLSLSLIHFNFNPLNTALCVRWDFSFQGEDRAGINNGAMEQKQKLFQRDLIWLNFRLELFHEIQALEEVLGTISQSQQLSLIRQMEKEEEESSWAWNSIEHNMK